jgi:hypothetical protein
MDQATAIRAEAPPITIVGGTKEVRHATGSRRNALLSRSCPSDVEDILSEAHVKRGRRIVHGDKELYERLGRDPLEPLAVDRSPTSTDSIGRSALRGMAAPNQSGSPHVYIQVDGKGFHHAAVEGVVSAAA